MLVCSCKGYIDDVNDADTYCINTISRDAYYINIIGIKNAPRKGELGAV